MQVLEGHPGRGGLSDPLRRSIGSGGNGGGEYNGALTKSASRAGYEGALLPGRGEALMPMGCGGLSPSRPMSQGMMMSTNKQSEALLTAIPRLWEESEASHAVAHATPANSKSSSRKPSRPGSRPPSAQYVRPPSAGRSAVASTDFHLGAISQ